MAVSLWLLAGAQAAIGARIGIFGFRPDLLLTFLSCLCFFLPRSAGTVLGFFCGLFGGALVGAHLFASILSRTVASLIPSMVRNRGIEVSLLVVAITTAVITVLAGLLWMLLAAPSGVVSFLGDTIRSAVYNGILSLPLYAILRRFLRPVALTGL